MNQLATAGYSSIALDVYGSGLSVLSEGVEDPTFDTIASDVKALLEGLRIRPENAVAVGHSMGGIIVPKLALKCNLRGSVLIGPVLPKPAMAEIFNTRIETAKKEGMEPMAKTIPFAATGSKATLTQKAFIRALLLSQEPEGYIALCRAIAQADVPPYANIKCPVLVLSGGEDKTSPIPDAQKILSDSRPAVHSLSSRDFTRSTDDEMPTRRVRDCERRRCAEACESCKRRKQRCDGRRPCARCIKRGLGHECHESQSASNNGARRILASSLPSPDPDRLSNITEQTTPAGSITVGNRSGLTSVDETYVDDGTSSSLQLLSNTQPERLPRMSRLVQDTRGEYMFIGDSATLSFLQNIRRIVRRSIGDCTLVDDPLRHGIVEASPETRRGWILSSAQNPPPRQSEQELDYLVKWYMQSANCVLLLFDQTELDQGIRKWIEDGQDIADPASSVYYLVFAIGAQTGPEDKDDLAETFFNYARYLTVETLIEEPGIVTIQAFVLIAMYLLGASRRNAAFMYLGMGVRAAYAIGLHRHDIASLFSANESRAREQLWKGIRILDLFMSASLGRPPSTSELRDTTNPQNYSACNDLSMIFELILTDVYAKRMISPEILERISKHLRRWTAQCGEGLAVDGIEQDDLIRDQNGEEQPNIGLIHLKLTGHWTVMLLSLPFLHKAVSQHVEDNEQSAQGTAKRSSSANQVLVHSCLESAVRTVDLLQTLVRTGTIPKRLPIVGNSAFVSGLVLGAAIFGDFDNSFPLEKSLHAARGVLDRFSRYDAVAKRHLMILDHLQNACDIYMDNRARLRMERQRYLVNGLFGSIHTIGKSPLRNSQQPEGNSRIGSTDGIQTQPQTPRPGQVANEMTEEQQGFSIEGGEQTDIDVDISADAFLGISPNMLWFDSFDTTMSLFPIVDTQIMGDEMMANGVNNQE
ncbi:transcriptional activator Mut3p [Fusarium subglutinans]|uniref:Transcriptional activator Mut3p n=1 Tax=Gibberella subglutinans TaxID=42677 RepID=A0A8H5PGT8_GIBSU|nr:transcriptional activator Mut3p [Fusarium subglutinans]KAF5596424.1 transcriptional activator Mut3p [Fusarium subglutinans]